MLGIGRPRIRVALASAAIPSGRRLCFAPPAPDCQCRVESTDAKQASRGHLMLNAQEDNGDSTTCSNKAFFAECNNLEGKTYVQGKSQIQSHRPFAHSIHSVSRPRGCASSSKLQSRRGSLIGLKKEKREENKSACVALIREKKKKQGRASKAVEKKSLILITPLWYIDTSHCASFPNFVRSYSLCRSSCTSS